MTLPCPTCGGHLGPWKNARSPEDEPWYYRECDRCGYQWAEWKLVRRGFEGYRKVLTIRRGEESQ